MIDTTPRDWNAPEPEPAPSGAPRSPGRELARWIVLIAVTLVIPMLLLGATFAAAHVEGCGGG